MRKFIFLLLSVFAVHYIFAGGVVVLAHEGGYTTALANHLKRWLSIEGVQSAVHTPSSMSGALAKARLAFLVGFNEPTKAEMKALTAFRERGGKLVVFHSASPQLGRLMGVTPLGYTKARYPGCWSRMDFNTKMPDGLPVSVRQSSTVLQRALPVKGQGRVIATWSDRQGRSTGDAAWIATSGGFWMTHVLLADGDEDLKARLLGAIVGSIDSRLWNFSRHLSREMARKEATRRFALEQTSRPGEIHAVWDHSGCGLYPGDWPRTMRVLKDAKITDIFVNVAGAGFAHYASDILPRSKTFQQEGDQLSRCVAAARVSGIRVHAWILCFTATRATPERLEIFRKRGWRLKNREGKLTEYLDPSNADVRSYILDAVSELQSRYQIDGVHLDFVRWYERSAKPADSVSVISRFGADSRRRVKRPKWLTAAVLGKYPACVASVAQDWDAWLEMNLIDYAVPMDYTESNSKFESFIVQHASKKSHARRTIAGLGITANESRLDARKTIEQIKIARRYNLAGVALFDLDVNLEKNILPYLKLGVW
jgi:uncharacterized lipoprotein YddW (UPF0748 family)